MKKREMVEGFIKGLSPIPGFSMTPSLGGISLVGKWGRIVSVLKIDYEKDTVTPDQTVSFDSLDDMEEKGKALVLFALNGNAIQELMRYYTKVHGGG